MATWDKWLPDVLPHVPGCPIPVVHHELRRAAQSLLSKARAWKRTLPAVAVIANNPNVNLTPETPAEQKIVRPEAAWYDSVRLTPTTDEELDASAGEDWANHTGTPTHYLMMTPGVVTLYPKPTANSITGLKVRVSLCPSDNATTIPDDLALLYSDEIAMGAKARLMMYRNKPWTDANVGMVLEASFKIAIDSAASRASRSLAGGRIAARPTWA